MGQPPVPDQVNLVVSDMQATVAFYRRLGLTIPDTDPEWQSHHRSAEVAGGIDLDFDSATFARRWDKGWRGGMGVLGFKLDPRERVDEIYADPTGAGYAGQQDPYERSGAPATPSSRTLTGNPVGIMSPIDPDRKSDPGFPVTAEPVERARRICLALPESYEEETWGEATFRVREKIFCMAGGHDPATPSISLKASREDQQALLAQGEPFFFPAYVGPKGWIGVDLTSRRVDWTELEELITDSYRLIAPKKLAAQITAEASPSPGG
ncbi:MAG: MmcQ/YjbR family DNA-binding protein [Acidimicrobiales bacterium]